MEIGVFYPAPARLGERRAHPHDAEAAAMDSVEQHLERGMVHHRLVRRGPCARGKS
jgi:hypothetical protein